MKISELRKIIREEASTNYEWGALAALEQITYKLEYLETALYNAYRALHELDIQGQDKFKEAIKDTDSNLKVIQKMYKKLSKQIRILSRK